MRIHHVIHETVLFYHELVIQAGIQVAAEVLLEDADCAVAGCGHLMGKFICLIPNSPSEQPS